MIPTTILSEYEMQGLNPCHNIGLQSSHRSAASGCPQYEFKYRYMGVYVLVVYPAHNLLRSPYGEIFRNIRRIAR